MLQQVQLEVHDMTTVGWKKTKKPFIYTFLKQAINQWWIVYFFWDFFGLQVDHGNSSLLAELEPNLGW